jgi:ABC-type sugar transport system ATPase subunit/ribose/xylose/arabinose/galactoside ABC-type transport system permease subunit
VNDGTAALSLAKVRKTFGAVAALRDASFDVLPGEVHALLGENGAGKSTLMAIASGELAPDAGVIEIAGQRVGSLTPQAAQRLGLAIVHQAPALGPDLTVAENMLLAIPKALRPGAGGGAWVREQLARAGCTADPRARVEDLSIAQRQLVEVAKALALHPRILILDEPTAPLDAGGVARLFAQIRAAAQGGAAVVYITHRLSEVREIADRVTVLRDGEVRGTGPTAAFTDGQILRLIVGRSVSSAFPAKRAGPDGQPPALTVRGLTGQNFHDVDLSVAPGEIVGLAGIAGNGQSDVLRALAGLAPARGSAVLGGSALPLDAPDRSWRAGVAYLPADRHAEGVLMKLSVRENVALSALPRLARFGLVRPGQEAGAVDRQRQALAIRAASSGTEVSALSGGNQQKVALARCLLTQPDLVLADEPTQGIDAGARIGIYQILRDIAARGTPVVVVSSDTLELEGLCDRVVVFSRGQVIGELSGEDITEDRIAQTMVTSTAHRKRGDETAPSRLAALASFARGDYAPSAALLAAIVALAVITQAHGGRFLSSFNLSSQLTLLAALAFVSLGQLIVIVTGGIDISAGPLAGLVAVIASFFLTTGKPGGVIAAGIMLMLAAAAGTGLCNGLLVRLGRFPPVAATLTTYIALQGISLLLRPFQGGYISSSVANAIQARVGPVPVAFAVAAAGGAGLEVALRRSAWGRSLRLVGSDAESARRAGVRVGATVIGAYLACSLLTFLGGVMLTAQIGVGDPTQGIAYTLESITAVVLGGTSLRGGRGSFLGALLGAMLIQELLNAMVFFSLSQAWQYWFEGLFVLVAAAAYTRARDGGQLAGLAAPVRGPAPATAAAAGGRPGGASRLPGKEKS